MTNPVKAFALFALGLAIAGMGIYIASADDAPGAAVIGFLLMLAAVLFGVRTAQNRLPVWAGRGALAVGALTAAFAAFLTHAVTVAAPLFAQAPDVPSVLLELGYVSNRSDLKKLTSDAWRQRTGDAIVQAIGTYFTTRVAGAATGPQAKRE